MQILHLDSSILGAGSVSRLLSKATVDRLCQDAPHARVVRRDLVADPIPHLDGAIAAGFRDSGVAEFDQVARAEHARSEKLVGELLESDVIVVGAPMYNFSVSSQLKAWIDRVVQPGRTFQFSPAGAVGKAVGKRAIVVSARGGAYSSGPALSMDFQESYLEAVFAFLGITSVRFVRAEGVKGPDRDRSISAAMAAAEKASKWVCEA